MTKIKKYKEVFLIIVLVIIDQLLKFSISKDAVIIEGVLKFTYIENTGRSLWNFFF